MVVSNWSGSAPSVQKKYSTFSSGVPTVVLGHGIMYRFCSRWIVSRNEVDTGGDPGIIPEIESGIAAAVPVHVSQYTLA